MTAAGSSATDALHQLYDRTTYALGYSSSQRNSTEGDGKAQQDGAGGSQATSDSDSDDDGHAPLSGPGNHPSNRVKRSKRRFSDHDHSEYKNELTEEEDTDTRIDEVGVSAGRHRQETRYHDDDDDAGRAKTGAGHRNDGEGDQHNWRQGSSGKPPDALARALGDDGPVGTLKGAPIDRELQKDARARELANKGKVPGDEGALSDPSSVKGKNVIYNSTAEAAAGADVGEPLQSERNRAELRKQAKKRFRRFRKGNEDAEREDEGASVVPNGTGDSDDDNDSRHDDEVLAAGSGTVTEQHPDQKGPMWASRPNDEQREKLRQNAAKERKRRDHNHHLQGLRPRSKRESTDSKHDDERAHESQEEGQDASAAPDEEMAAAKAGKTLFRFRLERRLNEGQIANGDGDTGPEDHGEERKIQDKTPGEQRSQPSTPKPSQMPSRFASFFGNNASSSSNMRPRRSTQHSNSGEHVEPDTSQPGANEASHAASPTEEKPRGDDHQTQNSKMQRISKLMMTGQSQRNRKAEGRESEDEDGDNHERGVDGVKMPSTQAPGASARWSVLRQKIRETSSKREKDSEPKSRIVGQMSVITELQSGILPVFMLKMALERDEQGHRRIPVLLNHVRLRISDSVNPLHTSSAIFRLELEYGDGLIRWVCYRSLRDFINLHTHYRAAALKGYLGRSIGAGEGDVGLPKFPKTSLPYFNQLQRQGWGRNGDNVRAQFAKAQRESLEDYLVELIKRTMFRPEANRLCKFFELSALSVSLAARGGYQGKQGYLRILSRSSRKDAQHGVLTPLHWAQTHQQKWFLVRESYIAIVEQPDSLQVFDVFLIDSAFEIVRPTRLYKQTLNFAHELGGSDAPKTPSADNSSPGNENEKNKDSHATQHHGEASEKPANPSTAAKDAANPSAATDRKDETALLTEGQWKGNDEDEYSGVGSNRSNVSSHTFYIKNHERRLKLVANNERQMNQFIASMERVARRTIFGKANRFGSFAPIRLNCNAQWLVDGRDYFWQVSRALMRAKDRIFIHDWWLSPEVYLRRPGNPKYRLDNILKKKASEGVKVFVILYNEVSNSFTPTDSNYTKQRLIGLHRNIFVQRSPSHFQTGTFYWAHHEKLCVIDETIAFMGGLDLCFGRWDTPGHVLTDNIHEAVTDVPKDHVEASSAERPEHDPTLIGPGVQGREFFVWPGQDFANERVMEWYDLTKPDVDLFNRNHYPRMPWHDVGLQLIGQPARDLCRHFTQRWNYLLRIKNHKRLMPFLIPPPDFQPSELSKYDLTGTCEAQICRSAGPWSLGTGNTIEHSIQNAYLKAIQMSEHFVYIENQFFVTSTEVRGTVIENSIGEALVSRIIRAHREKTPWRAVIVIPIIPGFPLPIDHPDATSVRLIVELQTRSICHGEQSIFGKLRRRGIDPADYIDFFSLRQWGKLPSGRLTTEQVYIHGKCMVVDDRLALIGSANINERSQRGDRDSELACVVRDTDMIDSTMGGKPFKVGRFAHSLRLRLMREHLGVDVDELDEKALAEDRRPEEMLDEDNMWDPDHEQSRGDEEQESGQTTIPQRTQATMFGKTVLEAAVPMSKGAREEAKQRTGQVLDRVTSNGTRHSPLSGDEDEGSSSKKTGEDVAQPLSDRINHIASNPSTQTLNALDDPVAAANVPHSGAIVATAEERHLAETAASNDGAGDSKQKQSHSAAVDNSSGSRVKSAMQEHMSSNPWAVPNTTPKIDPKIFIDPLDDRFYRNTWMAAAVHNTQIYRKVFKSVPDDTVNTWSEYKAFQAWAERLGRSGPAAGGNGSTGPEQKPSASSQQQTANGAARNGHGADNSGASKIAGKDEKNASANAAKSDNDSDNANAGTASNKDSPGGGANPSREHADKHSSGMPGSSTNSQPQPQQQFLPHSVVSAGYDGSIDDGAADASNGGKQQKPSGHKPSPSSATAGDTANDDTFTAEELEQMEKLLGTTRGVLVLHATRFLEAELRSDNLLFNLDRLNPLNVYA